jgi:hypothetical protein
MDQSTTAENIIGNDGVEVDEVDEVDEGDEGDEGDKGDKGDEGDEGDDGDEDMGEMADALGYAIHEQKEFKKAYKNVFDQNRDINKRLGDLKARIHTAMVEQGTDMLVHGEIEIELRKKSILKHDLPLLQSIMVAENSYVDYMASVTVNTQNLMTRKAKIPKGE